MNYKVEEVKPFKNEKNKKEQVIEMFDSIAEDYDKLNGVLALGIDNYWRKEAIKILKKYKPNNLLDIATGTGDFALLAHKHLKPQSIIGIDISEGMMEVAKIKTKNINAEEIISFQNQDCSSLSFADNSFDAVTAAFGVRNFHDIDKSFKEVLRVLRPGGVFLFIELSTPQGPIMHRLYKTYIQYIMPLIAGAMDAEKNAYHYLPESIVHFPEGREMMLILKKNGFTNIRLRRLTLGIVTVYIAEKNKS